MKILLILILTFYSSLATSIEIIKIYSPYSSSHSGTPALLKIIEEANNNQKKYKFLLEFRPGGNQIIAVNSLNENDLAIIAPAYVDHISTGKLNQDNYVPIFALGDACWAVIINKPIQGQNEFTVGGVGYGNASHLTALALGEKFKFNIRYIIFRSNNDALINMVGNNGIELVIDRYESFKIFKDKNPKLEMIAASCPIRLTQEPNIKTLKEMGLDVPYIFNIIISLKTMPIDKRKELQDIFLTATNKIGEKELFKLSAIRPPQFDNITTEDFYKKSIETVKKLQIRYKNHLTND